MAGPADEGLAQAIEYFELAIQEDPSFAAASAGLARAHVAQAEYYNGRPIGIDLPNSMTLEVVDTSAVMKTATKNASSKPAKLDNGVTVNVPEFVETGTRIRVNPETGEYLDRAKD